jgi:hypothetical protein
MGGLLVVEFVRTIVPLSGTGHPIADAVSCVTLTGTRIDTGVDTRFLRDSGFGWGDPG